MELAFWRFVLGPHNALRRSDIRGPFQASGFPKPSGLGLGFSSFGVWGLGFRVLQGLGLRVQGLKFKVPQHAWWSRTHMPKLGGYWLFRA